MSARDRQALEEGQFVGGEAGAAGGDDEHALIVCDPCERQQQRPALCAAEVKVLHDPHDRPLQRERLGEVAERRVHGVRRESLGAGGSGRTGEQ